MSNYAEIVVDRSIDEGWTTFRRRLAEYLLIDVFDGLRLASPATRHWVWIDRSDSTLVVQARVGKGARRHLRDLGLQRDDKVWGIELDVRYVDRAAHIVTSILRDVFQIVHPSFLAAEPTDHALWDDLADETPARFDLPVLAYPNDLAGLQALVDATLERSFGHPPTKDDDGDVPICNDEGGRAWVSVRDDSMVEVWTILATDVDPAKARRAIVRLSREFGLHKFQIWGNSLVASVPMFAHPFVPELLDGAIGGTLYLSVHLRDRVARTVQRTSHRKPKRHRKASAADPRPIDEIFPEDGDTSSRRSDRGEPF